MSQVEVLQFLYSHLIQIVTQHSVVEINKLSEMSMNDEGAIGPAELRGTSEFNLDHAELIFCSGSRSLDVEIGLFDVENYEFGQTLTRTNGGKLVLPVLRRGDFMSTHCFDVDHMNASCHFVD